LLEGKVIIAILDSTGHLGDAARTTEANDDC
jgi:hypothetical protein